MLGSSLSHILQWNRTMTYGLSHPSNGVLLGVFGAVLFFFFVVYRYKIYTPCQFHVILSTLSFHLAVNSLKSVFHFWVLIFLSITTNENNDKRKKTSIDRIYFIQYNSKKKKNQTAASKFLNLFVIIYWKNHKIKPAVYIYPQ